MTQPMVDPRLERALIHPSGVGMVADFVARVTVDDIGPEGWRWHPLDGAFHNALAAVGHAAVCEGVECPVDELSGAAVVVPWARRLAETGAPEVVARNLLSMHPAYMTAMPQAPDRVRQYEYLFIAVMVLWEPDPDDRWWSVLGEVIPDRLGSFLGPEVGGPLREPWRVGAVGFG